MFIRENIKKLLKKIVIKTLTHTGRVILLYYLTTYYFFIPKAIYLLR